MSANQSPPSQAATTHSKQYHIHPHVEYLKQVPQFEQRTPAWYDRRKTLMTASNVAAALSIKPFDSFQGDPREEAINQIVYGTFKGNVATRHGQKYEDSIRDRFDEIMGTKTLELGLIVHSDVHGEEHGLNWLGASLDGITNTGAAVEIKCPWRREIDPLEIPHHYVPQILVQMEVCNLEIGYFVQWQPAWLAKDGVEVFSIQTIQRDRAWFEQNKPLMKSFYDDLMHARANYVPPPPPPKLIRDALYHDISHAKASRMAFLEDTDDVETRQPLFLDD